MTRPKRSTDAALEALRAFGLRYPEATTSSPWPEHVDLVVRRKTFAFMSAPGAPFSIACKLPRSWRTALERTDTEPTPYGLGRSGWVTMRIADGQTVPVERVQSWIDESYRAQAPKRLVATLPTSEQGAMAKPAKKAASATAKKGARGTAKKGARGTAKKTPALHSEPRRR